VRLLSADEFLKSEESWNAMVENDPSSTIFSTWEWLSTFWKHFGDESRLAIFVLEKSNRLIAAAPLCYKTNDSPRQLQFIGTPRVDYADFVTTIGEKGTLKLLKHIRSQPPWESLQLEQVPQESRTPHLCSECFQRRFSVRVMDLVVCPYITLPREWAEYKKIHRRVARNARYYERKLRAEYSLDTKLHRKIELNDPLMDCLIQLHQRRQAELGHGGVFSTHEMQAFHKELAHLLSNKNRAILHILYADSVPISAYYAFIYRRWCGLYIKGINPDFSRFSPGYLHTSLLIKEIIDAKSSEVLDFTRGDEPYKFYFASERTVNRLITVQNVNASAQAANSSQPL